MMIPGSMLGDISLEEIVDHCTDGMFVLDRDRRFFLFSKGCERITGYESGGIVGTQCTCRDITDCRDRHGRSLGGALCPSMKIFGGDLTSARQRMHITHRDGHDVWVETVYSAVRDERGAVKYVVGIMRDMTDEKRVRDGLCQAEIRVRRAEQDEVRSRPVELSACGLGHSGEQRPLDYVLNTLEREEMLASLHRARGNRSLAARMLHISRSRFYRRIEALGIDPSEVGFDGDDLSRAS